MKKIIHIKLFAIFIILTIMAGMSYAFAQEIKFDATVSKRKVSVGEIFQLSYTLNVSVQRFEGPNLNEFVNYSGPNQSSSMQIINGQMTQSLTFYYRLAAKKEGKFTIPSATVLVANGTIKSNQVDIEVVAASSQTQQQNQQSTQQKQGQSSGVTNDRLFIRASVSKSEIYQNEQIIVTYKLFSKYGSINISDFKFPSFNGFYAYEIESSKNTTLQQENVNGEIFYTAELKQTILLPQKSGTLEIPTLEAEFIVRERTSAQSIFEQFFGGGYRDVKFKTKSKPLKITVNPFPSAGKPANFAGAVGDLSLKAEIDKDKLKTNDALNLKVTISGRGSLKLIDKLNINFPVEWEVYDPQITDKISLNTSGMSGSRTFEFLIIPKAGGNYKLGPIALDYFNPLKKSYEKTESPVLNIAVERGKDEPVYNAKAGNKAELKILGTDVRYISSSPGEFKKVGEKSFFASKIFYTLAFIPPFFLLILLLFRRSRNKQNADVQGMKFRKANKIAMLKLKEAEKALKAGNKELFFNEVSKSIFGFLSDKFSIPLSELSRDSIRIKLSEKGVSEDKISEVLSLIDQCELARFAPSQTLDMKTVYDLAVNFISKNQSKSKTLNLPKLLLMLALFSFTGMNATPVEDLFHDGVKTYNDGNYQEAVNKWNKIIEVYRLESSSIYNNLGNAYYKLTDYPNAILHFEKAIRLEPSNEDAVYNLNVTNLKITDKIEPLPELFYQTWYKNIVNALNDNQWALLFLILLFTATIFFSIYIISNTLSLRKKGFYFGIILYFLASIVFVFGKSSYAKSTYENFAIVYSSRLPVKSSPSDMGTDLFFIHAGTKVETIDRIGNWVKIKIVDGNQGWIEEEHIEMI